MGAGGIDFQQVAVLGGADPAASTARYPRCSSSAVSAGSEPSRSTAAMNEDPVAIARAVLG
jgi:hypothetical protein